MKKRIMPLLCVILLLLCACGGQEAAEDTESTIYIKDDGKIECLIVEDFPEDEYSAEDLYETTKEIIEIYNNDHTSGAVRLGSCEVRDGKAYVKINYASGEDYAAFNRVEFFYGTVRDGLEKGYGKKSTLKNAYGSNMISGDAIADLSSYHMVVVTEQMQVKADESVLYYSANLDHIDDKTVRVSSEGSGDAILILK